MTPPYSSRSEVVNFPPGESRAQDVGWVEGAGEPHQLCERRWWGSLRSPTLQNLTASPREVVDAAPYA